ncbi:MAG TPA: cupin domain-containing protein [Terriglobales bacterium]|nr:cupin domain-containing protein [Terriglobales bacterium]
MKLISINSALKRLKKLNDEIRYADCFKEPQFSSGLIAFRPSKSGDPKQIEHIDKDVVCQVIKGSGRLRVDGKRMTLRPGVICHIPKGTPHDFSAGKNGALVLFYSLIKTG